MFVVYLGALFVFCGMLFMVLSLSGKDGLAPRDVPPSEIPGATLERRNPGAGFGLKGNWPGLVLVVLGGVLLLVGGFS